MPSLLSLKKIETIKDEILGKEYSLSVAFVSEKKSREINKKYRKKDRATNVLSFALSKNLGELILCQDVIKYEAKNLGKTAPEWLGFLVIHGMLHLKGRKHNARMEAEERKYDKKYFYRNRPRVGDDQGHSRRIRNRRKKS
ncbi:MAG TPA: rRNA maturation RNase YbeY [Candidatus Paceibacterota bacterium]|jgi:probable rRNA maturation factor|nr:rRNA maturation RNase YbeY [Candidatus Paceibacterota bacterium]